MISRKVIFIVLSLAQLTLGLILMIVNGAGTMNDILSATTFWWLYGFPFVVIGAVGFVAPRKQTFMGWFLILNIIGLVLALCWWVETIHALRILDGPYGCKTSTECKAFGYFLGLTLVTGAAAIMCIIGIVMAAKNISDDNLVTAQNGGYVYSQQLNTNVPQQPYSAQPTAHAYYVPVQSQTAPAI